MGYELMVGHEIGEQREDWRFSLVRLSVGRGRGGGRGIRVKGHVRADPIRRKREGIEKPRMQPSSSCVQ